MGYNTAVLIVNDALTEIENDLEFGKRLAEAIRQYEYTRGLPGAGKRIDVRAAAMSTPRRSTAWSMLT